jgi:hypothetical protein
MASSSIDNASANANTPRFNALCVVAGMIISYDNSSNMVNNLAIEPYNNASEEDFLD